MTVPDELLANLHSLPALPGTVARLSGVLHDERSSAADVEKILHQDPSLTANLLKIANSAYFGAPRKISSVRQAAALLGAKRLFEVAAGAAFSEILPRNLPGYSLDRDAFWRHSIAAAVLAGRLAEEVGLGKLEFIFTAALLHDIGKLAIGVILSRYEGLFRESLLEGAITSLAAEKQILGTDHAEVGGRLAELWRLPEPLILAARCHHEPRLAQSGPEVKFVALVHVADGLCHAIGYGEDTGEMARSLDNETIRGLGIPIRKLERVAGETMDQIGEMCGIFQAITREGP